MVLYTYAKVLLARTVSRVLFGGRRKSITVSTHSQLDPLRSFLFHVELHGVARSFAVVNITLFIRGSPSAVVIVFAPAVTYRKKLCELGITFVGVLSQGRQVLHSSWCAGFSFRCLAVHYLLIPGPLSEHRRIGCEYLRTLRGRRVSRRDLHTLTA